MLQSPFVSPLEAQRGDVVSPVILRQPPTLNNPCGKCLPGGIRAFLEAHKDLLMGPLAFDCDPDIDLEFMFRPLARIHPLLRNPDGTMRPGRVPGALQGVPVCDWPYPGPAPLRFLWTKDAVATGFVAVTTFVLRVNILSLELAANAESFPTASPGDVEHTIGLYLSLLLDVCVRGAAALESTTEVDALADTTLLTVTAVREDEVDVLRYIDTFTTDGVNELPVHEMPPTPFTLPDLTQTLPIYHSVAPGVDYVKVSTPGAVAATEKDAALARGTAKTDIPAVVNRKGEKAGRAKRVQKRRGRRTTAAPHCVHDNLLLRILGKAQPAVCARRSTAVMITNRLKDPKGKPFDGREGTRVLIASALYLSLTGHAWEDSRNRAPFRVRVAADALFCSPSNLDTFMAWLGIVIPVTKDTAENLMLTAIVETMCAIDGIVPAPAACLTRDFRVECYHLGACRAMTAMRRRYATMAWPLFVCISPALSKPLSDAHYGTGQRPFKKAIPSRLEVVRDAVTAACSQPADGAESAVGLVPGTEFVVAGGRSIPRGVYDVVLVDMQSRVKGVKVTTAAMEEAEAMEHERIATATELAFDEGVRAMNEQSSLPSGKESSVTDAGASTMAPLSSVGAMDMLTDMGIGVVGLDTGSVCTDDTAPHAHGEALGVEAREVGAAFGGGGEFNVFHGGQTVVKSMRRFVDVNGSVFISASAVSGCIVRAMTQRLRFGSSEARDTLAKLVVAFVEVVVTNDVLVATLKFLLKSMRRDVFRRAHAPYRPFTPDDQVRLDAIHNDHRESDDRDAGIFMDFLKLTDDLHTLPTKVGTFLHGRIMSLSARGLTAVMTILFAASRAKGIQIFPLPREVAERQRHALHTKFFATPGREGTTLPLPHTAFHVHTCTSCMAVKTFHVKSTDVGIDERQATGADKVFHDPCPGCNNLRVPAADAHRMAPTFEAHGLAFATEASDGLAGLCCEVCRGVGHVLRCASEIMSASASKGSVSRCHAGVSTFNLRGSVLMFDGKTYTHCVECGSLFMGVSERYTCFQCVRDAPVGPEAAIAAMTPAELETALKFGGRAGLPDAAFPKFCILGCGCTPTGMFQPRGVWALAPLKHPRPMTRTRVSARADGTVFLETVPYMETHGCVWRIVCSRHRDGILDAVLDAACVPPTLNQLSNLVIERIRAGEAAQATIVKQVMRNRRPAEGSSAAAFVAKTADRQRKVGRMMSPFVAIQSWKTATSAGNAATPLQVEWLYILWSMAQIVAYDVSLDKRFASQARLFTTSAVYDTVKPMETNKNPSRKRVTWSTKAKAKAKAKAKLKTRAKVQHTQTDLKK